MSQTKSGNGSGSWEKFLKLHRTMVILSIIAIALAAADAVYVFLWFVGNAQSTGLVPSVLGTWTMGNLVAFILNAVFWELLLFGIPLVAAAVVGWLWWRRLPEAERSTYQFSRRGSRTANGGSAISTLLFIAFIIKVYIDGNWNAAISSYTLNYVVYSVFWILIWGLVIIGIPVAIGVLWWVRHVMKKT